MKRRIATFLVMSATFWVRPSSGAEPALRIFDVVSVTCASGAAPDMTHVYPPGAVVKMKEDVVEAFAKANSDRNSVILRYPIAKEGLDPSAPPPCKGGDVLLIQLKRHLTVPANVADKN